MYEQLTDLFVSDYAATNPGEDIVETFTYFFLKAEPSCTNRATIGKQKVCMFYEYPTLKNIRIEIRENL